MRCALAEQRFDVWEFFDDGPYDAHHEEKTEVERLVQDLVAQWSDADVASVLAKHERYLVRR